MPQYTALQTNQQTDGQTDDIMMPIADHTVYHYARLTRKLCYRM